MEKVFDPRELILWLVRQSKECEWVEFKLNFHSAEEIGYDISALANGACLHQQPHAYIVFGVTDELGVNGTTFDPYNVKRGNEPIENWISQRLSPRIDYRFIEAEVQTKRLVIVEIPAARNQPVEFEYVPYIRIGNVTRKLRDFPDKERKIWNSRPDEVFIKEIALDNVREQEIIDLLDTQSFFDLLKIPYPSTREETIRKVEQHELITRSRGAYRITNLGAILFAKRLQNFPTIKRKAPRVIVYEGKDKLKTKRDQVGSMGYVSAFESLIDYINSQLPANEEISRVIRSEVRMYPVEAVREIVANALIHQDFSEHGSGPVIEIYSDRIEVTNPGVPLITPLRFIDGYKSRNEKLANLMRLCGICEERGSGVDRVVSLSELFQLPAPLFRVLEHQTQAILYSYKKLNDMDKEDKIRACYQHCSLRYMSNDHMTNQSLRERFKITAQNSAIASRIIGDSLDAKLIKLEDEESRSKKYARYVPIWA
jgi:predicted HTH transcriptional regulator